MPSALECPGEAAWLRVSMEGEAQGSSLVTGIPSRGKWLHQPSGTGPSSSASALTGTCCPGAASAASE